MCGNIFGLRLGKKLCDAARESISRYLAEGNCGPFVNSWDGFRKRLEVGSRR